MPVSSEHDKHTAECLQPTSEESLRVSTRSWRLWGKLLKSAASTKYYPAPCFNMQVLLSQTPSIPSHPKIKEDVGNNLYLERISEWDIGHRDGCSFQCTTKSARLQKVHVASLEPNFCQLSKQTTPTSSSGHHNKETPINYLAIFILGWSYVFSARLVELCRKSSADHIIYKDSRATIGVKPRETKDDSTFSIHAGDLTAVELRWWMAILAPGCGWQAVLFRSNRQYYPQRSCHLNEEHHFEIITSTRVTDVDFCPPSSNEAQQYLIAFAKVHNACDQLQVALAACLTLAPQIRFGTPIELPHPKARCSQCIKAKSVAQGTNESHILHYMALSCIPNIISSSMFGCLWEPGIECYLASEWLHPAQTLFQSIKEEEKSQTIVKMMALHRPSSAPLWLGAAATGLLPTLLRIVSEHLPPMSLEATIWTKSTQSFMDPQFHRKPPMCKDSNGKTLITCEDELRMLYITDLESWRYASPPLSPWPPFGTVDINTTSLVVQRHINCAHQLIYKQWMWQLEGGLTLPDFGFATSVEEIPRKRSSFVGWFRSQMAFLRGDPYCSRRFVLDKAYSKSMSRSATRCIFQWSLSDGVRADENGLWEHEWLRDLLDDESESEDEGAEAALHTSIECQF